MSDENVPDATVDHEGVVERDHIAAGYSEDDVDPESTQRLDDRVGTRHRRGGAGSLLDLAGECPREAHASTSNAASMMLSASMRWYL